MSEQQDVTTATTGDTAVTTKKTTKGSTASTKRDALMYVGPNRPYDLPLMKNQVFAGSSAPAFCTALVEEKEHFAACFVSVLTLGESLAQLKNDKSDLSRAVAKVARETAQLRKDGGN